MRVDEKGYPVLTLADVPGSGVARVDVNAESGNPRHDTRSGKFTSGGQQDPDRPGTVQANLPTAQAEELARYFDAVRDAAREMDDWGEGDIAEFLRGRAKDMNQVDLEQFVLRVRRQRLDDIADILDTSLRRDGRLVSVRRRIKLQAPKGWLKRSMNNLQTEEVAEVARRLVARGHDTEDVVASFTTRVSEERAQAVEAALGGTQ